DLIFRSALTRDAQLGFSGGDDQSSYLVSASMLNQAGVIRGSEFNRGGLRLNLDRGVTSALRISTNLSATRSVNNMVRSSTINGYRSIGIVRQAVTYIPMQYQDNTKLS